jgi:hypothetical protein
MRILSVSARILTMRCDKWGALRSGVVFLLHLAKK